MDYETVIGLEVHVQLKTQSKMFCSCRADYQTAPANSRVCPVCLGLPGTLPVINKKAVEFTIMMGLALGCEIPSLTKFDRKNYPYPDLMKGYQISQFDMPLAMNGQLDITTDGQDRCVRVERVHLEEDVSKLQHVNGGNSDAHSLVDVNRSGVPLMEVVSHPDMRTPDEARSYLTKLHSIIQYLGVSTANAQDGSFRCDANISLRPVGQEEYGTKAEIKNMNSLRSVFLALNHEEERQRKVLESGERVIQETRGWSEERNATYSQRSKEEAHDYRYFPDPDLVPLKISDEWIDRIRTRLPELPEARQNRYINRLGLNQKDAASIVDEPKRCDFFEQVLEAGVEPNRAAAMLLNYGARYANERGRDVADLGITATQIKQIADLSSAEMIGSTAAGELFAYCCDEPARSAQELAEAHNLLQVSETSALEGYVDQALTEAKNEKAVADIKAGKDKAIGALIGQVMKRSKGKANPKVVGELIRGKIRSTSG